MAFPETDVELSHPPTNNTAEESSANSGEEISPPFEPTPEPETFAEGDGSDGGASAASVEELLENDPEPEHVETADDQLKAVLEAIIYVTDEPLSLDQICAAIEQPQARVTAILEQLAADYERADRGLVIKEVAGGFKMSTKAEHHDAVRRFVKNLNPPMKLSLAALETLAVIAYKQPITAPEIMEIRGVQGASVLKTLLDRKLIGTAGRKPVVGKPILYKTTREFLVQFGLKDLNELPTLKEFQELGRMDTEAAAPAEMANTGESAQLPLTPVESAGEPGAPVEEPEEPVTPKPDEPPSEDEPGEKEPGPEDPPVSDPEVPGQGF